MVLGYFRLRKIIPSHLKTQPAGSIDEARHKVISLYRTSLRYAAEIQTIYPLDVSVVEIRQKMRQEVEKNRFVKELDVINMLTMQGAIELEETLYMWKTQSHVMKYFKPAADEEERASKGFLKDFYANK